MEKILHTKQSSRLELEQYEQQQQKLGFHTSTSE